MTEKNEQKVELAWKLVRREYRPIEGTAEMIVDVVGRDGPRMAHSDAKWEEVYLWEAKVYVETESPNPPQQPTPPLDALRALEKEWREDVERGTSYLNDESDRAVLSCADDLASTIKAMGGEK
jgi:hypothetical protein